MTSLHRFRYFMQSISFFMSSSIHVLEKLHLILQILPAPLHHRGMVWSSVNPAWGRCISRLVPQAEEVSQVSQQSFVRSDMFFLAFVTQAYAVVSDVINLFKKKIIKNW